MTWSETIWKRMEPIYQRILTMPFITELMDGTLAIDRFQFYMMQDVHIVCRLLPMQAYAISTLRNVYACP